ncbi:hypothetical protein FH972_010556 [Carpinus fangiana]|uniref:Uncharacterized protein n=1 Tax=Carpinus fangiana TaxID=176857 RepID=A0A660KRG0_9ROSI|nr:hypothetical protein FH972_010556 [Carpinus fangiana]
MAGSVPVHPTTAHCKAPPRSPWQDQMLKHSSFIARSQRDLRTLFGVLWQAGSSSVEAKHVAHKDREQLTVVGGTVPFAFARWLVVFAQTTI